MNTIQVTKNDPDFQGMYWLTSIKKRKDNYRKYAQYVYCDGDLLVNTDGARLHILVSTELNPEKGFYELVKRNKSEIVLIKASVDAEFPDWENSLFRNKVKPKLIQKCASSGYFDSTAANIIRYLPENYCVNLGFLKDMVSPEIDHIELNKNNEGVLYFCDNVENPSRLGALMAIKEGECVA